MTGPDRESSTSSGADPASGTGFSLRHQFPHPRTPHRSRFSAGRTTSAAEGFGHQQSNNRRSGARPSTGSAVRLRHQRLAYIISILGIRSHRQPDDRRQQMGCDRWDHADAQRPVSRFQKLARSLAVRGPSAGCRGCEARPFSELRKPSLACASLDEHSAQSLLQLLHLHGQGRLRDPASRCRVSEVALTRQRIEIAELPQRYVGHQKILSQQSLKSILPDEVHRLFSARTREEAAMDDVTKCPFTGRARGRTTRDWWPDQLDSACSIATPHCRTRWTRRSITPRNSRASTSGP